MMTTKQFSVVKFIFDNTVEFLPSSWLNKEGEKTVVKFPAHLNSESNTLRRNPVSRPKPSWPTWEVEVKKTYDSLDKAERKTEKYKDTSDIESSAAERTLRSGTTKDSAPSLVLNAPPGTFTRPDVQPESSQTDNQPLSPSSSSQSGIPLANGDINFDQNDHLQQNGDYTGLLVTTFEGDPTLKLILEEQRAFQAKSLENQAILYQNQIEIKTLLVRVLSSKPAEELGPQAMYDLVPLKSEEALQTLEGFLEQSSNRERLSSALRRYGLTEMSKTVRAIINYLFEVKFQREVRYTNDSGKIPVRDTRICECIRESVQLNHPEFKRDVINSKIAAYLRGSEDRGGGRKLRNGKVKKKNNKKKSQESGGGVPEIIEVNGSESSLASQPDAPESPTE